MSDGTHKHTSPNAYISELITQPNRAHQLARNQHNYDDDHTQLLRYILYTIWEDV